MKKGARPLAGQNPVTTTRTPQGADEMTQKYAGDATFDDGRMDALEIALVTLVKRQPDEMRTAFCTLFQQNIKTFEEVTLALPISEAWREGLSIQAAKILRRLE